MKVATRIGRTSLSVTLLSVGVLAARAPAQDVGEEPEAIEAATWIQHAGAVPSLELLRGQTVIVHFFRMEYIETLAHWNILRKFHYEYADKGLVILAITDAPLSRVEHYIAEDNLPFAIGVGTKMFNDWHVPGDFHQVTLGTDGLIFARGPTNSMWNGKLLKGLKGARRLGDRFCLRIVPQDPPGKRLRKALGQLAEGELAKGLKTIEAVERSGSSSPEDRADAGKLREAVEAHVAHLMAQLEENLARREVLLVEEVLDALTDELARHPLGQAARDRREELDRLPEHALEVESAEAFVKLMEAYYKRGYEKNTARAEKLIEAYPNTRGAEKARNWFQQRSL